MNWGLQRCRWVINQQECDSDSVLFLQFDLLSQHRPEVFTASVNSEIISIQPRDTKVACDSTYSIVPHNVSFQLQEGEDRKSSFILPDLNLPVEGDSSSGILVWEESVRYWFCPFQFIQRLCVIIHVSAPPNSIACWVDVSTKPIAFLTCMRIFVFFTWRYWG